MQVSLSTEHVIGRLPSCALRLDSSFVSTTHALIRWNGEQWGIRDLGSTNGTYVNGQRVAVGELVPLMRGAIVWFGDREESWQLVDDSGPSVAAIPLDGGEPCVLEDGLIGIPSRAEPAATIHAEAGQWFLETSDTKVRLEPGQLFRAARREWRFECPRGAASTVASAERPSSLRDSLLVLDVSPDEEHAAVTLKMPDRTRELGERACFYLLVVLARRRIEDQRNSAAEHGWVDTHTLMKLMPEYTSYAHLNVDIFRVRGLLSQAGIHDASSIIERRRGQLRLGTDRFEIRRAGDAGS